MHKTPTNGAIWSGQAYIKMLSVSPRAHQLSRSILLGDLNNEWLLHKVTRRNLNYTHIDLLISVTIETLPKGRKHNT